MKLAIFGGTFNPVHIGHLAMADDVCSTLGYDKILFVPAFVPPHKIAKDMESPENRVAMLAAAFKDDERFEVEPCEIERGGTSYTIDTVKYIIEKYKGQLEGKPGLLMGQENASEFDKWRQSEEIAKLCNLIVARRIKVDSINTNGFENKSTGAYTGGFENTLTDEIKSPFDFIQHKNQILPLSSTEVRARIAENNGWRYLVSSGVFEYIVKNKLYGYND